MIVNVVTYSRRGGPRAPREDLLSIQWKCKLCGVQIRFRRALSMYLLMVPPSTLMMTFDFVGALHTALVHTCGEDVDAVPLWQRPEWS